MNIQMIRNHTYDVDAKEQAGVTRTLPAGWSGEVDDDVGAAVVKAGAGIDLSPKKAKD